MRSHRWRLICPTHAKKPKKKEKHYIWACVPAPPPPPTHCHLRPRIATSARTATPQVGHSSILASRRAVTHWFSPPTRSAVSVSPIRRLVWGPRSIGHRCAAPSLGVYAPVGPSLGVWTPVGPSLSVRAPVGPSLSLGARSPRPQCAAPSQGLWTPPRSSLSMGAPSIWHRCAAPPPSVNFYHQQQRNVRLVRPAARALGRLNCKIAFYDGGPCVQAERSFPSCNRRNPPSHSLPGATLLPTV